MQFAASRYRWYARQLDIDWPESPFAHGDSLMADACSLAYDNAVAEHYSGRHPRIWSKEIPLA